MADLDGIKEGKRFHEDIPQKAEKFFLKGSDSYDWGMKNRLSRIFNPKSGRTVMLAVDHGYFQGPTTGLERIDLNINPIAKYADSLMLTRGMLRGVVPPSKQMPVVLRGTGGISMLSADMSDEGTSLDMEDAIRLNASAVAMQVYIGAKYERQTIIAMTDMVNKGLRYGMPVLGVTAVGKDMVRDARYFMLATRICAELGANVVKTYFVPEGFEKVCAQCPVPIVMAGGKKLPEIDALTMAYNAVQQGASGVDMGRNIFQSDCPEAMIQAVRAVVHQNEKPEKALDLYESIKNAKA